MSFIDVFNRFEALSSDWDFFQNGTADEIKGRLRDRMEQPGILPDVDAKSFDLQKFLPTKFPITTPATGQIDVGPLTAIVGSDRHTAYDPDGERVDFPVGDAVVFKADTPIITTTGITGSTATPFSTGRLAVPVPNLPLAGTESRYVFVAYLRVVNTELLPPDHENIPPNPFSGATGHRKPITGIDELQGIAYAHQLIDGYRVYIALPGEVDDTGAYPILVTLDPNNDLNPHKPGPNTSFPNFANAIYTGRFTTDTVGNVTDIQPSDSQADTPRPMLSFRPIERVRIPAKDEIQDLTDPANPIDLLIYQEGSEVSTREHIQALGTGAASARNPHAQAVGDFTQGQATPDNIEYQRESDGDGIYDVNQPSNSQLDTTALVTTVVSGSISVTATIDPIIRTEGPASTGQFSGQLDARLEVIQLIDGQSVYINGIRVTKIRPVLNDAPPLAGDKGIIPFADAAGTPADTEGNYVIFIQSSEDGRVTVDDVEVSSVIMAPGDGVLGKVFLSAGQTSKDVLKPFQFPIAQVYWNKTQQRIQRTKYDSTAAVIDLRSSGLLKKPQVSTEGFIDPTKGIMALSVYENILTNADFALASGVGVADVKDQTPWYWSTKPSGTIGTITPTIITPTSIPDPVFNTEEGPRSQTGVKVSCTVPVGNNYLHSILSPLPELKPNTIYTISAWGKILNTSTNRLTVSTRFANKGSTVSMTVGDYRTLDLIRDSSSWQRAVVAVKTNSSPDTSILDPANVNISALELKFENLETDNTPTDPTDFYFANIVVVEGDWTSGFVGPKVHSGEIFLWDKTTSCPPGSVEVTDLRGRVPVGANPPTGGSMDVSTVSGAAQQTTFDIGGSASVNLVTGVVSTDPGHVHYASENATWDLGFSLIEGWKSADFFNPSFPSTVNGDHDHTLSGSAVGTISVDMPEYALLYCRRL